MDLDILQRDIDGLKELTADLPELLPILRALAHNPQLVADAAAAASRAAGDVAKLAATCRMIARARSAPWRTGSARWRRRGPPRRTRPSS